tara:strand:+ start:33448 stop:33615 length:168 start_codon:yes stop_codon:yes gene_type:complete
MATTIKTVTGEKARHVTAKVDAKIDDRIKELRSMGVNSVEAITVKDGKPRSIIRA